MDRRILGIVATLAALTAAAPAHAADKIYWGKLNTSQVRVGNLDGSGGVADLFTGTGARGIGIDAARIIFADGGNGLVRSGGLDGSGPTTLFGSQFPIGLTIDPAAGRIYWANFGSDSIRVGNLDGTGSATDLFAGEDDPKGIAIDTQAGKLYWANQGGDAIRVGNVDGTGAADLFTGEGFAEGVALDVAAGKIYWGANNDIRVGNLNGTGASTLFAGESSSGIAIDPAAGKIYWANIGASSIRVANLDGSGTPQALYQEPAGSATAYPAILKPPVAAGPPTISGEGTSASPLRCGAGQYAPDEIGAFLFRAAGTFAYSWSLDGTPVAGETGETLVAKSSGNYSCTVTGSNPAGSASPQTSEAVAVSVAAANCKPLRKKLKRQKQGLRRATTKVKRRTISDNIGDTKQRLRKRGC